MRSAKIVQDASEHVFSNVAIKGKIVSPKHFHRPLVLRRIKDGNGRLLRDDGLIQDAG